MSARRGWLAVPLLLLLVAGGGIWWWSAHRLPAIVWQGYAEADFVKVGPTQQGLLTALFVKRGDVVATGAPLFAQDDTDDRAARDQAAQMFGQAAKQLANLQEGGKPTEIEQAEANLADALATSGRTAVDLARGEALLAKGFATNQSVDLLRAENRSAHAKAEALQAALTQSRAPLGRDREIEGQRALLAALQSALDKAEWRLGQRRVVAPAGGRVADVLARPGETMAAGAPVVSLLPPGNIFVRFFVPEAALSTIHLGDTLLLACDSCPADLSATISFISPQTEYTPPVIYSASSKAKLVFLVEARPRQDQAAGLNPGQPIEVRPAAAPTP
jgi:HlyD family secretion protein